MERIHRTAAGAVLLLLAAAAAVAGASAAGPGLEGTWRLVEQTYGEGGSNLASGTSPVLLRFVRQGAGHAASLVSPSDPAEAWPWPSWAASGALLPVRLATLQESEEGDAVRAVYTVRPSPGDPLVLEVTEDYAVEPGSGDLVGTVKVVFQTEEGPRGGFTLHRRFERQP